MELRQLKYFLRAKELMNFTEAAHSLNISQSTLSQQIKQLEDELNIPLFNRIGKRIFLTEAGEMFAISAQQSLSKSQEGLQRLRDLKNLKTGKLTIGVIYSMRILFAKTLIEFAKLYPGISIKVIFGTTQDLFQKLDANQFDFILTFHDENKVESHLKYQYLLATQMVLVTSKNSEIARKKSISIENIAELPLALPFSGYSTIQFFVDSFEQKNLKPNICMEINDIPTLFEIVKTGHWHTILSETSVNDAEVVAIPIEGEKMRRIIKIVSLKEVYEKKAVNEFYKVLKNIDFNLIIG